MTKRLHKGSLFLSDYAGIVTKLCEVNPDAAGRFCDAVEHGLRLIASHPLLGAKSGFVHAPEVRKWVIRPFSDYLLFYQVRPDGILLIRLLHGSQDLPPLIPPG